MKLSIDLFSKTLYKLQELLVIIDFACKCVYIQHTSRKLITKFHCFLSSWNILISVRRSLYLFNSFQFSHSVVSDYLRPHELQHVRPSCPSPTPRIHPNPCPSSQWCHPAISSSVVPFSSFPQSLPASQSFPTLCMRWPKYWSFSFSIIPSKEYPGLISFRMDWLDLLAFQGTFESLLQHHSPKASILQRSAFFTVQLSYPYMTTGEISSTCSVQFCSTWQSMQRSHKSAVPQNTWGD